MFAIERESPQPFYQQIKDSLRQRISLGDFKPGKPIPHEEVIATELGVSRMTVHRALVELGQEGLLERIRGKGTFVRGSFAPQNSSRKTTIALVGAGGPRLLTGRFYSNIAVGIFTEADSNFQFVFRSITTPHDAFAASLRLDTSLKALIVLGVSDHALLQQLTKLQMPIVIADCVQSESEPLFDEVNHNGEPGSYGAVSSLIHLGHRDIALMETPVDSPLHRPRRAGYERAFAYNGVPLRQELMFKVHGFEEAAYGAMYKILKGPQIPTAVFCTTDEMAVGVIAAINEYGWRVPQDISVVGYGDIGGYTHPLLSSVRVPTEQMGAAAVEMLRERFQSPTAPRKKLILPTEWIPRGTCACPRIALTSPESNTEMQAAGN